jgi:hypothetical protein
MVAPEPRISKVINVLRPDDMLRNALDHGGVAVPGVAGRGRVGRLPYRQGVCAPTMATDLGTHTPADDDGRRVGALIGMYTHRERHKTNKTYFVAVATFAALVRLAIIGTGTYLRIRS